MKNMKKLLFGLVMMFTIAMIAPSVLPKEFGATEVQAAVVGTPKLVSATASGTNKAVIKWNAASGATGYRVFRRVAGQGWQPVKTVTRTTLSITDTGLVPGRLYAYTVRAYRRVNGKVYWGAYNKTGLKVVAARSYLKLNRTAATVHLGKYCTLKLNGTNLKPAWRSSNTAVAVVNSAGKVTAKKVGSATITATLSGLRFTCKVNVTHYMSLAASTVTVSVGQTKSVAINSSYNTLYMRSNNSSIAAAGWQNATTSHYLLGIKGVKVGTTTVTIQNAKTNPTMKRVITVKVVASSTSAANTNKNRVASYISTYGSTNSNGDKFIKYSQTIDGIAHTWAVIYQKSYNRLRFQMSSDDGEAQAVVAMDVSLGTVSSAPTVFIWIYPEASAGFEASGRVPLSTFTSNSTISFTVTESAGMTSATLSQYAGPLANSELKGGFVGWDYILQSKTGLTMSDIGFVRYA